MNEATWTEVSKAILNQIKMFNVPKGPILVFAETHLGSKGLRRRTFINGKYIYFKNAEKQRNKNTKRKNK